MSDSFTPRPLHIAPEGGEHLKMKQDSIAIKLAAEQTYGLFSLVERVVAPRFESPPQFHMHPDTDWVAYVLEGRLLFHTENETYDCAAGHIAYLPRGTYFRWENPGGTPARALMVYTPGGFEGFFREAIPLIKKQAEDVGAYERTLPDILRIQDKYRMQRRGE